MTALRTEKIWFILNEGLVEGPFDVGGIEEKLSNITNVVQIWGRGNPEWLDISSWRQKIRSLAVEVKKSDENQATWLIRTEGKESQPMSYKEMITYLKSIKDFSSIDLCNLEQRKWKELYAFQRVADDLGITRRSHPRVPIMGTLHGESPQGAVQAKIISISEGGLGVTDATKLRIGDRIKGTLTSPNLFMTINCSCDVVFVGEDGYAGLKFASIPIDAKSSIIAYVNKFALQPES